MNEMKIKMPPIAAEPVPAPPGIASVSNEQKEIAFGGPAIYSNRVFVNVSPGGVRISFCEQLDPTMPLNRLGEYFLPAQDAVGLMEVLRQFLVPPANPN